MNTGYTSVNPNRTWVKYAECTEGQLIVEGYFVGQAPGKFTYDNYFFDALTGEHIAVNGCASLAKAIDGVKLGSQCKLIYGGSKVLPAKHKFAGKSAHQVELLVMGGRPGVAAQVEQEIEDTGMDL